MSTLVNIYGDEDQIRDIIEILKGNGVDCSDMHDAISASAKLDSPLSSPDLLAEMLKMVTAALQTAAAVVTLYNSIKQVADAKKPITIVKERDGRALEVTGKTTKDQVKEFIDK